jgi:hypothetical protein
MVAFMPSSITDFTIEQIARALGGDICGNGADRSVLAPGPGHGPKDRSMSLKFASTAPDGFLVHSFGKDDPLVLKDHVRRVMGLPAFGERRRKRRHNRPAQTDIDDVEARVAAAFARHEARNNARHNDGATSDGRIVDSYDYTDAHGELLYQVVRFEPKDFRQRRPDGNGSWIANLDGVERVPFNLKALADPNDQSPIVFFFEGEKDALRGKSLGLVATTISGGTKWSQQLAKYFAGREVAVIPDHDEAGRYKAWECANALHGIATSIRVVKLPGLSGRPGNKDFSDWLDADPTRGNLFVDICKSTEYWTPCPAPPKPAAAKNSRRQRRTVASDPHQASENDFMTHRTALACNVGNILKALQIKPELQGAFGYDEMARTEILLRPLFADDPHFKKRPVTDADVAAVQAHLQWFGFRKLGKDTTHQAIDKIARDNAFHPLRDYLNGLAWDGTERLPEWLYAYLGAESNKYTAGIGTMFLIGMVARILRPGCRHNYMPIFENDQGTLKSTTCSVLAGEYFSDNLPDISRGTEASQHLRGKWLIEVAELRAYSRAELDHFKEFLVRDVERYRPKWGRKEVHEPRQCVFVGTTNKSLYLRDETGNRRFWPVKCDRIEIEHLKRDRDQLFAEAVWRFKNGEAWWPTAQFERENIAAEQEARFEADAWEQPIQRYLDTLLTKRVTVLDVAVGALGYELERPTANAYQPPERGTPINRLSKGDQMRIASVLTHLKWVPKRTMRERWWEPKTTPAWQP